MGPAAMVPVALAAAGAAQGAEEERQAKRMNKAAAEQTRFSDITGRAGQLRSPRSTAFGGALQGGTAGLGLAASGGAFDKGGAFGGLFQKQ